MLLGSLAWMAVTCRSASADLVSTTFGWGSDTNGISVSFTTDGSNPQSSGSATNTSAGPFASQLWVTTSQTSGSPFLTFCVDLAHSLNSGTVLSAQNSTVSGTIYDGRDIGAAGWVMTNYINASTSNPSLPNSFLQGLGSVSTAEEYAAIQIAIWEVTYEPSAYGINDHRDSYRFYSSDSKVMTLAGAILTAYQHATNPDSTSIGFINYPPNQNTNGNWQTRSQDMIYLTGGGVTGQDVAAPEPSSLATAALGAVIALNYRWRARRRAALGH
jgi:hypothetical protein